METFQLITSSYSEIQGFGMLRAVGSSLLGLALVIYMAVEMYKLLNNGRADFLTPLIKIGAAMIILNCIVPIGDFFSSSMYLLSNAIFEENVNALAAKAWATAFDNVSDPGFLDYIEAFFSPVAWICLLTYLQLVGIMVIKLVIIDILWPVMFGLVLFSGVIAVPIGIFPGVNTFKGWCMNLVEVAIWPIVFQIVTTLLFACFSGQMARLAEMEKIWEMNDQIEAEAEMVEHLVGSDRADKLRKEKNKEVDGKMFTLFKYLAINTAFAFLTIFVPFISRKIVRGETAGFLGGIIAAYSARLVSRTITRAGKWLGGKGLAVGKYAFGSVFIKPFTKDAGGGGGEKSPAEKMDKRGTAGVRA